MIYDDVFNILPTDCLQLQLLNILLIVIGVSGSYFRGGQQLHSAQIQSLPAKIFYQAVLPMGRNER